MSLPWIAAAACVLLLLVVLLLRLRAARGSDPGRVSNDLDTVIAWEPQATRLLTAQERIAYDVLRQALPECMVLAQVPLSRFIKVPTRNSYAEWLRRIGQLSPDLVICDETSQVIAVVDVRPPVHLSSERARARHDRMRRVLRRAGIPMHVWQENALPSPEAARAALLPNQAAATDAVADLPAALAMAGADDAGPPTVPLSPALMPLDLDDAGFQPDEVIEMREPPPSTWFDEFDSGPVPLRSIPPADRLKTKA